MHRLATLAMAACLVTASPAAGRKRSGESTAHAKRFGAALGLRLAGSWNAANASGGSRADLDALLRALGVQVPSRPVMAPDFVLSDVNGRVVSLRAFRGRVVLLNFWATWCPPCRAELPDMARLGEAYQDEGFVVVTVATDREGARAVKPVVAHLPGTVVALLDPDSGVAAQYGARALPTSLLIDRDGRVVGQATGQRYWFSQAAQALIRALL